MNNLLNINTETGNTAVDEFFKRNVQLINNFMMALIENRLRNPFYYKNSCSLSNKPEKVSDGVIPYREGDLDKNTPAPARTNIMTFDTEFLYTIFY